LGQGEKKGIRSRKKLDKQIAELSNHNKQEGRKKRRGTGKESEEDGKRTGRPESWCPSTVHIKSPPTSIKARAVIKLTQKGNYKGTDREKGNVKQKRGGKTQRHLLASLLSLLTGTAAEKRKKKRALAGWQLCVLHLRGRLQVKRKTYQTQGRTEA